ncbi:MAG: hypothetical protein LBD25_06380, partial [Coriobacteriales bacterium]|nr:hypothetical protein [Coriobacteriales bacterium]
MLGHSSALQASADAVAPYANARTFYLTGLLAGAIGIIVFSWPTKARHRSLSVAAHLGTGVLLSLATLCYGAASKLNLVPVGLMVVVCLLVSGAGFAWFSIHLLAQLARQRQQRLILASIAAGLLLKTAFAPLVHGVFASESQFVTALLLPLVVSVAAIALQCAASGSTVPELSSLPKASTTDSRILVILLLATALLRAIIRMISTMGFWGSGPTSNSLLQVFDIALVTLLLVVAVWVTLLKQRDQTLSLRFLPAYLIILAGFFFLDPQIIDIVGINTWLAYVINIFFELFTHLFFWYLIVCGMRALALHPYKVGGLTVFAYALVSAVSTLLFSQADATYRLSAVILLYVIIIIIMSIFK